MKYTHLLAAVPVLWLTAFYTLCLRTWLWVGHLPYSNTPDPSQLPFTLHAALVYYSLITALAAPIIWTAIMLVMLFYKKQPSNKHKYPHFAISAITYAVFALLIYTDPYALLNWFID